jgi:uncharacterized RDD family membrane protein YckC
MQSYHDIRDLAQSYKSGLVVRRWLGAWIDFVVVAAILIVPDATLGNDRYQATSAVWLTLCVLYFPVTEGLTGRSLGKLVTGTKVVTVAGHRPGVLRALVRTLTRLVEVNPLLLGGTPAAIAVLASRNHQRLGDMAAGTYVVKAKDLTQLAPRAYEWQ